MADSAHIAAGKAKNKAIADKQSEFDKQQADKAKAKADAEAPVKKPRRRVRAKK
jgi:hypothetical protein